MTTDVTRTLPETTIDTEEHDCPASFELPWPVWCDKGKGKHAIHSCVGSIGDIHYSVVWWTDEEQEEGLPF